MRFKLFPFDLEAVGKLRLLYPYMMLEQKGGHTCVLDIKMLPNGQPELQIPLAAAINGTYDIEAALFLQDHVYVIQRPLDKVYAPLCAWLKAQGKKVVIDIDDWMHGIPAGNIAAKALTRSNTASLEVLEHCLRYADVVTTATPKLAELYAKYTSRTVVMPNFIRKADWEVVPKAYSLERPGPRIGWMGWMRHREEDLRILKPVLQKALRKHPDLIFVNVGRPDTLEYLGVPRERRIHVPGAKFPAHAFATSEIDIGLVPLAKNAFNECKSYLKGMEYGAAGIPVIASPTEQYRSWVTEGENGFLARSTEEWLASIDAMLENDTWRVMGKANHDKAMQNLIDDNWPLWRDLYEDRSSDLHPRPAELHGALLRKPPAIRGM